MAKRPVYIPSKHKLKVDTHLLEFKWYSGFSKQQKQRSYTSLHNEVKKNFGDCNILEISTSSQAEIGRDLSAFNLEIVTRKNKRLTVETAFQGSKLFDNGGPYTDLYGLDSLKAKKDNRLISSGNLRGFSFFNEVFPLNPQTFFYDWIYINALHNNEEYKEKILTYDAFTDIEFNPDKSINNQAYSAAVYVSLVTLGLIEDALKSKDNFLLVMGDIYKCKEKVSIQNQLF